MYAIASFREESVQRRWVGPHFVGELASDKETRTKNVANLVPENVRCVGMRHVGVIQCFLFASTR